MGAFLKWAGGKRWFVNNESHRFPNQYNRYIEPFLGSGAVFFFLKPAQAILSDVNEELINTYIAVRDEVDAVCMHLKIHERKHSEEYYYKVRERSTRTSYTAAARMIYLNKNCYNGIYRVNRAGKFNVPYGTPKEYRVDEAGLNDASTILQNVQIFLQDFENTIDLAEQDDFLFCDPPYAVMNEDERFVSYTANTFSWNDQVRLANALERAKNRGVKIIMTNVEHEAVRALYENIDGFVLESVTRSCNISGTLEGRRTYDELIVSANL